MTDVDEAKTLARYKAALDFLKGPLAAASGAAHDVWSDSPSGSDEQSKDEFVDERITALGGIAFMANELCNPKLQLLESIAHLLWKDGDDDDEDEDEDQESD
jgi:hypothetical protein